MSSPLVASPLGKPEEADPTPFQDEGYSEAWALSQPPQFTAKMAREPASELLELFAKAAQSTVSADEAPQRAVKLESASSSAQDVNAAAAFADFYAAVSAAVQVGEAPGMAVDAVSAPKSSAPVTKPTAVAGPGYNPAINTAQWNIPAMFGGSAAKAVAVLSQFNGQGVHIADYDNGIDKSVTALMAHYDASRELVIGGKKADPGVASSGSAGDHGTATAGLIIADAATNGGTLTGLAYGAQLTAVNIFSGVAANNMMTAMGLMANFDVTNNSWGWTDKWADSSSFAFGAQFLGAIKSAVDTGRAGLGTVVVHAAGNDWGVNRRDANSEEFGADRHVINVAAISSNGDVSYYSERGSSVLVGASSGGNTNLYIATTDKSGTAGYASGAVTNGFNGTSAAAPEITALAADMLSANSRLGWRDVQNILALTANDVETSAFTTRATGQMAYGWTVNHAVGVNGGGYHFSNDAGFGLANGHDAVREAEVWSYFSPTPQTSANELHLGASAGAQAISTAAAGTSFKFTIAQNVSIENVALSFNITTKNLNNLSVTLTGPSGTSSIMLGASTGAAAAATNFNWMLGSHAFLGELSAGSWTVTFKDTVAADKATVNKSSLDIYGAATTAPRVFHYTDEAAMMLAFDASRLVIHDKGGAGDWLDTAAMTGNTAINLTSGATSTANGRAFVTIGTDTTINNVTLGDGAAAVTGNNNGDTFVAGHGAATILGGSGNDTFYTGWANDMLTGGAGKDVFAFNHAGFGQDTIADFVQGQDKISLKGLATAFAKLKIVDTGSQITVSNITAAAADTITLLNTRNQHLGAADFLFA